MTLILLAVALLAVLAGPPLLMAIVAAMFKR